MNSTTNISGFFLKGKETNISVDYCHDILMINTQFNIGM
jgi:hypothetical protein